MQKPKITENFTEFQKELKAFTFSTQILKLRLGTLMKTFLRLGTLMPD